MVYVCSDIHGEYNLFLKLLEKINFSSADTMYIGGDIIDKGEYSVTLLNFIKNAPNIHAIMGNHEYDFLNYYWKIMQNSPSDFNEVLNSLKKYFYTDKHLLTWDTVDYIESLPYYAETDNFILVHAGVPVDSDNKIIHPSNSKVENLIYDRRFKEPSLLPITNKCVMYGHTPSPYICNQAKIIKYKNPLSTQTDISAYVKIHLDVGTWLNGILGCLCVDTMEEFYVF